MLQTSKAWCQLDTSQTFKGWSQICYKHPKPGVRYVTNIQILVSDMLQTSKGWCQMCYKHPKPGVSCYAVSTKLVG